jgi:hypothetical protein
VTNNLIWCWIICFGGEYFFWCQVNYLVLNKLVGVPSINFGDEKIYFGATTILFGGALNGCLIAINKLKQREDQCVGVV